MHRHVVVDTHTLVVNALHKQQKQQQHSEAVGSRLRQVCAFPFVLPFGRAQLSTCRCMANTAPHGGADSDACAHGGDMSSRASQWPCPQPPTTASTRWRLVKSTTACGHRGRTGPGRLRTELYGDRSPKQPGMRCSSSCLTKTPHPALLRHAHA